jgi:D-sedoheptulose 7-phosphate isomerase
MNQSDFIHKYLEETAKIANDLDSATIEKVLLILSKVKSLKGRIFFLGVGGGAAAGSHAANDFNKIAMISSICLSDNPALITALANDEGWEFVFKRQLQMHNLESRDCLFIFSVGGGTDTVSKNIVRAIQYEKVVGAKIVGVVGKEHGAAAKEADACIIIPCPDISRITPHTEDFQMIINHLISNILAGTK